MNQDQFLGILRVVVPAALTYVVGKGWIPAGSTADVGSAVIGVAAAAWSYFAHSDSSKIASVAAIPEIAKIIVAPTAAPSSAAAVAAADSSQPKVSKT